MTTTDAGRARAEAVFRPDSGRHEKGSAMSLIAEENKATEDKTARLRALRLQREATVVIEAPMPVRKLTRRTAGR